MSERRKRRVWTDDEKRMICSQTLVPGVSVSQVARRYDVNANLVFTWLRDPRFAGAVSSEDAPGFLPLEVIEAPPRVPCSTRGEGRVEIELSCGHRLRISGGYDPEALVRLIRGLSS